MKTKIEFGAVGEWLQQECADSEPSLRDSDSYRLGYLMGCVARILNDDVCRDELRAEMEQLQKGKTYKF